MSKLLAIVLLAFSFFADKALASDRPCLHAVLRIDSNERLAWFDVESNNRLQPPDKSWKLVQSTSQHHTTFEKDISHNELPDGRQYPGVIHLANGLILLSLRHFVTDSTGHSPVCTTIDFAIDAGADIQVQLVNGYTLIGHGRPLKISGIIADDRLPVTLTDSYRLLFESTQSFYSGMLGRKVTPASSILFLTDGENTDSTSGCSYAGSSLPGLLLIGLRSGCREPGRALPSDLAQFIAHETFHQWNYAIAPKEENSDAPFRLMLLEGGAELAGHIAVARGKPDRDAYLISAITSDAEDCTATQQRAKQSVAALLSREDKWLAYPCGAVYTFLQSARLDKDPVLGFSLLWKRLLLATESASVAQTDRSTNAIFNTEEHFFENLASQFMRIGYALQPSQQPSDAQRFRVAVEVVRNILRSDCAGNYGMYTGSGKIVIDPELKSCRSVAPGKRPASINDFDLYTNSIQARDAWKISCETGGNVRLGYQDGDVQASNVSCAVAPTDSYSPLTITRIN